MNWLRKLRAWTRREQIDAEMRAEMQYHLEEQARRNREAGMPALEADHAAQRQFGNVASIQERVRENRGWLWLEHLARDLRFAVRSLRRAPIFSLTVIATFALCLGPNAAILNTLYALVLKPQPFHEPQQIVRVYNVFAKVGGTVNRQDSSTPQYRDFKANADLFADFAVMRYFGTTLGEETVPERGFGMRVNAGFFDFFGVKPVLGRFPTSEEEVSGRDRVLVLAERYWRARYNGDPNVIGRTALVSGEPWTIIGVAPRSVEVLDIHTMFFKPFESVANEENPMARYTPRVVLFGRLRPGVTREAALEQLAAIDRRFVDEKATPALRDFVRASGQRIGLGDAGDQTASAAKAPLVLLQLGAALVLLIGAVNIANLLLARANARQSEFAVRLALGAGRGTLLRQMLVESVLLTLAAVTTGAGLAWASLKAVNLYLNKLAWTASPIGMEPPVVVAIAAVALGLGILVGLLPFATLWRTGLKLGATRTTSSSIAMRRLGAALVAAQMAVALTLLVGAGLLVRSFGRVMAIDPGFDAAHLVQGRVGLPQAYATLEKNLTLQQRLVDGMREIPGVDRVALVFDPVLGPASRSFPFLRRSAPLEDKDNKPQVNYAMVSPDFFPTMDVRLLAGRLFTDADHRRNGPVAIVDDLFVRRYFPDRNPLGEEISLVASPSPVANEWARIVGVVRRAQLTGLEQRDGLPFVYVPMIQQPSGGFTVVVRSERPAGDVLAAMRQKLKEIDPAMPLYSAASLQDGLDDLVRNRRGIMTMLGLFAALAALLSGVGLYGVLAYDVSQRTREIGIRGAIGASRAEIVGLILRQGIAKTGLGFGAGLLGAFYLGRLLRGQLFDVEPLDPMTFGGVSLLLFGVALLASWLPARRAAKVDPVVALRAE